MVKFEPEEVATMMIFDGWIADFVLDAADSDVPPDGVFASTMFYYSVVFESPFDD